MSAFFQGPDRGARHKVGQAEQQQRDRGRRRTALWATIAGVGWFNGRGWTVQRKKKGSAVNRAAFQRGSAFLLGGGAGGLPKRLRNFSTRPPMLLTDFCVPV